MPTLKSKLELYLQQIFRMLLESKTEEAIAKELGVSTRTVQWYKVILDQRYTTIWKQKTNDSLFLECALFKNRMLKLYKALEDQVVSDKTSGTDKAKCAEIAANIAIDVLKMESEEIKAVQEIISNNNNNNNNNNNINKGQRYLNNLRSSRQLTQENVYYDDESDNIQKEYNPNRKF